MEKFKALAWHWQLLILVGIGSIVYLGVWYMVTSETRVEIQNLNDQIAQLQAKNQSAQIATQRINEFRSLYASKTAEYDELKVLLPEEREITNVLQGLQDTARDSRLIVMRFSPRDDTQQDGFMSKPVEVEVDSNFNNLRAFFEKMAKLQRIVSVTDFNLKQLEKQTADKTLHAQFLLTAYYASPENLTAANSTPQPVAPNGQPAPNGQAAAPPAPTAQPAVAK
jgi:type IV pilus assembly protein PilO